MIRMVTYSKGTSKPLEPTGIRKYLKVSKRLVVEEDKSSGDLLVLPSSFHTQRTTQHNDVSEIKTTIEEDSPGDSDGEEASIHSDDHEDFAWSDLGNVADDEDLGFAIIEDHEDWGFQNPTDNNNMDVGRMLSYKLPFDDGSGRTHRLVDNSASDGDSISLAIAALACGICQKGVIFNVASDALQLRARFGDAEGFICLKKPDRFLIPITLSSEPADCGTEIYDNMVLQPTENGREFGRTMQQEQ